MISRRGDCSCNVVLFFYALWVVSFPGFSPEKASYSCEFLL